ncbi:hypothetical protein FKP32DRAFT_344902 [Trametes sanguinea]|nr:hypothetical protein FKP32DRAFT_344902 [Trametes sanguinea]
MDSLLPLCIERRPRWIKESWWSADGHRASESFLCEAHLKNSFDLLCAKSLLGVHTASAIASGRLPGPRNKVVLIVGPQKFFRGQEPFDQFSVQSGHSLAMKNCGPRHLLMLGNLVHGCNPIVSIYRTQTAESFSVLVIKLLWSPQVMGRTVSTPSSRLDARYPLGLSCIVRRHHTDAYAC